MTKKGGPGAAPTPRARVNFKAVAAELMQRAEELVPEWMPGGTRDGPEYKGLSTSKGGPGDSWVVNLNTGLWAHFASGKGGHDLLGLFAALHGDLDQATAAHKAIQDYNLPNCYEAPGTAPAPPAASTPARASAPSAPGPEKAAGAGAKKPHAAEKGEFVPVTPVPAHAPRDKCVHSHRGTPAAVWEYWRGDDFYGYVCRFVTSTGGKEVLPRVWGQSQANGTQKWIWKHWAAPKPLYLPGRVLRAGVPKLVVEGEKCADAAHQLVGDAFDVVSWPGGGKSADKAAWDWLMGDGSATVQVFFWPDADSQRRKLTPEEQAAHVDPATVDYLPADKQPGVVAMRKAAGALYELGAQCWMCDVPELPARADLPPKVSDGWDCYDAIHVDGWGAEQLANYVRTARRWEPAAPQGSESRGQRSAGASETSADDDPKAWRLGLIRNPDTGAIKAARENIVLALQSLPEVRGQIAFNEFTNDIIKLRAMPWGSPAGKWSEVDELLMGEWLVRAHYLPSMPRTTLEEGMRMVATRHQYHPVREYLHSLKWDGTPRLNTWLIRAVVGDPAKLSKRRTKYMRRVGAWMLMGMAARAMRPGVKFDYMPIFEGAQGMRKSTVLACLAGDWFADTGFVLGDKDSLQMLQGRWLYEISELDAMARAEVTKIKAFIASRADWYRASFDKRPREYPRQLIFAGTTNEHQYLVDGTGNRRFWPIEVTRIIDTEMVLRERDQLFAEAWARVQQGERYHPDNREELELFLPEQTARMVESPIEMKLLDYLVNHLDGQLVKEAQAVNLLAAIHIDITKLGPGRFHEKQVGTAMRKFGWVRARSSAPGRPWVYRKPAGWPDCMNLDDLDDEPPAPAPAAAPAAAPADPDAGRHLEQAHERADYDDGSNEPF